MEEFIERAINEKGKEREILTNAMLKTLPKMYHEMILEMQKSDKNLLEIAKKYKLDEDDFKLLLLPVFPELKPIQEIAIFKQIGKAFRNVGREIGKATKGWALRWTKGNLVISTPVKWTKISKTQLAVGSAVAIGAVLAFTPVGPAVLSSLGTMASKAGALGLSALSKVASFAAKGGISMLEAAKRLGISQDTLLKEFETFRQMDSQGYNEFIDTLYANPNELRYNGNPVLGSFGFGMNEMLLFGGGALLLILLLTQQRPIIIRKE